MVGDFGICRTSCAARLDRVACRFVAFDPIAGATRAASDRSRSERPWPWPEHIGASMPHAFG
jgi:hypothetical protein